LSIWYSQTLRCARCSHPFSETLARGIHAKRLPEVREQILRGELHHVRCPACNELVEAHRDLAYTDFTRHHWVQVASPDQLPQWASLERDALAIFDRHVRHGPAIVAPLADRFRVRLVFELDELRERLLIWGAELDDAVVECVKLVCLRARPAIAGPTRRIRLRAIEDGAFVLAAIERTRPRVDLARWIVPPAAIEAIARDDWRARVPELFGAGFVSLDRYLLGE
jgi:hypothetical protein